MKSKTKKEKHYPAYYLAVVLAGILMLEGFLMGAANAQAWSEGLAVLDVSSSVSMVIADMTEIITTPVMDQVSYVNKFYQVAATEMTKLVDVSDDDILMFPRGVSEFYRLASLEMEKLLDFSDAVQYIPQVAGASISQ